MDEIRFVTELYYDVQKIRIMTVNRLSQLERDGEDLEKAQYLQSWIDERLVVIEKEIKKRTARYVREFDIWNEWLKDVKGIGPVLSACLLSWIAPIGRFATVSALWSYCGMSVVDGRAPARKKGAKITWSPKLRTTCWKISDCFVKSGGGEIYRQTYDEAKAFYRGQHSEPEWTGRVNRSGGKIMDYTDMHIHNMAKRKAVKLFLSHLWEKWRELEGLPVRPPYVIEKMGHTSYIPPERRAAAG